MAKKKITRLNKEFYVTDEYGHNDKQIVLKVNELVEAVNHLKRENEELKIMLNGQRVRR